MTTRPSAQPGTGPRGATLIRVRDLSVGFGTTAVLKDVNLEVPETGIVAIMGPAGVGKSTLLRTLGRWNWHQPSFWAHGSVELAGCDLFGLPLDEVHRYVALLAQKAKLYTASILENAVAAVRGKTPLSHSEKRELARSVLEPVGLWPELSSQLATPVTELSIVRQRMLALARQVSGGARCLLADEPLRDTERAEQDDLTALLKRLAEGVAIVIVTHNQRLARRLADEVHLLSGHRLVETARTEVFFNHAKSELARSFLRSGNCWPRHASTPVPPARPAWASTAERSAARPGGFHWIVPERLAGMQCPGLLGDMDEDLAKLRHLRVGKLVTLTETPLPAFTVDRHGIEGMHFPIRDMGVPEVEAARALCERVSRWLDAGERVALHCRAGLGRTGMMLAGVLVHRGQTAVDAIQHVRSINRLYIQNEQQLAFVSALAPLA